MRLCEYRAQPAFQRAAAAVIRKLGQSRAFAIMSAIKVGIDRAGEFAGLGIFACDSERRVMQFLPIAEHEVFPGLLVSGGTGTREGKFTDAKAEIEISDSRFLDVSRKVFLRDGQQNGAKLLATYRVLFRAAFLVKLRQKRI